MTTDVFNTLIASCEEAKAMLRKEEAPMTEDFLPHVDAIITATWAEVKGERLALAMEACLKLLHLCAGSMWVESDEAMPLVRTIEEAGR